MHRDLRRIRRRTVARQGRSPPLVFQMEVPRLLALDASKGAIRVFLRCQAISDDVNRELAAPVYKHCNTFDQLAPRP
jgi:hypothetical protein